MKKLVIVGLAALLCLDPMSGVAESKKKSTKRAKALPKIIGVHKSGEYLSKEEFSYFRNKTSAEKAGYIASIKNSLERLEPEVRSDIEPQFKGSWRYWATVSKENCSARGIDVEPRHDGVIKVTQEGKLIVVRHPVFIAAGSANESGFTFEDLHMVHWAGNFWGLLRANYTVQTRDPNTADLKMRWNVELAGLHCEIEYSGKLHKIK